MVQASIAMGSLGVAIWTVALVLCAYGMLLRAHGRKS